MKVVVVTGSTRGLGFGLARAFLDLGCRVVVSGRRPEGVREAVAALGGGDRVLGLPCDVTDPEAVRRLWQGAVNRFGRVDIWINNAGVAPPEASFVRLTPAQLEATVRTNLLGTLYGARIALEGMLEQGFGALYNVEGFGSSGRVRPGLTLYGTTKRAVAYLTDALIAEARGTPVRVGALRPGMLLTDLLLQGYREGTPEWARARKVFRLLADRVETVAPWLARRVLEERRHGVRIVWLTRRRLLWRLTLGRWLRPDPFAGEGAPAPPADVPPGGTSGGG